MTKRVSEVDEEVVDPRAGSQREGASPDGLPPLREVIERYELRAKKNLGQNFLLDLNIALNGDNAFCAF